MHTQIHPSIQNIKCSLTNLCSVKKKICQCVYVGSSNSNAGILGLVSPHHSSASNASSIMMTSGGNSMPATLPSDTFQSQPQPQPSPASTQKFECEKCNLAFPRLELLKEHQLIHILSVTNPQMFLNEATNPFALLQNLQQQQQLQSQQQPQPQQSQAPETVDLTSKSGSILSRKYSTDSAISDSQPTENLDIAKKLQKEQFDFLLNYFMQNETNDDLKKHSTNLNMDFLFSYYQTNEIKKNNLLKNYDFLHNYYMQNCDDNDEDDENSQEPDKLTLDFLLQYYRVNESKKVLQQPQPSQPNFSSALSTTSSTSHTATLLGDSNQASDIPTTNIVTSAENKATKRLRTTILPEQLNFLYECYQTESNPSRKMLEEISKKVNLKKRVVQVKKINSQIIYQIKKNYIVHIV